MSGVGDVKLWERPRARGARGQSALRKLTAAPRARATCVDAPAAAALSRGLCRAASSTRFQYAVEGVRGEHLASVVPEAELVEVEREIAARDLVVRPHDAALDERPEAIEMRGVHLASDILPLGMVHGLMLVAELSEAHIAAMLVRRDERYGRRHGPLHEVVHRNAGHAIHHLAHDVALAGDGPDDGHLAAGCA